MKRILFIGGVILAFFSLILVSEVSALSEISSKKTSSRPTRSIITSNYRTITPVYNTISTQTNRVSIDSTSNSSNLSTNRTSGNSVNSSNQNTSFTANNVNTNATVTPYLIPASRITSGNFGEDAGGYGGSYTFPAHVNAYNGFFTTAWGPNSGIRFTVDAGAEITQIPSPSVLKFQYGGKYYFDSNVGIGMGNSNPTYKLQVAGDGFFSSNVTGAEPTEPSHFATKNYVDLTDISTSRVTPGIFQYGEYRFPGTLVANELRFMPDRGPVLQLGDNMLRFIDGNTYYFDDKVGINTQNPDATLRVNGTLKANYYIAYNGKYGITNSYNVKSPNGGNCTMSFTNGLLTSSSCPTVFSQGSNK